MGVTLAFDVYGTLIDTAGVTFALRAYVGDRAPAFARLWRDKQLEYAYRRALMGKYRPFPVCTRQALDYACEASEVALSEADRQQLMGGYRVLPAFSDVPAALGDLAAAGHSLYAFSNGPADDVRSLLAHAQVRAHFDDVISVDEIGSFKPDPGVYRHFLRRARAPAPGDAWLISSNPFDVIGAAAVGMRTVWLNRDPGAVFDPWDVEPTVTLDDLKELAPVLAASR